MLFHPGFSTAPVKTELAGRGVGLDVVRANLNALNGEIDIQSTAGQGTKFTLKVPLTLIISPGAFRSLRTTPILLFRSQSSKKFAAFAQTKSKTSVASC